MNKSTKHQVGGSEPQLQVRTSDVAGDFERAVLAKEAEQRWASWPALQPHYYGRVIGIDLLERILKWSLQPQLKASLYDTKIAGHSNYIWLVDYSTDWGV